MSEKINNELQSLESSLRHKTDGFSPSQSYFEDMQASVLQRVDAKKSHRIFNLKRVVGIAASVCLILLVRGVFISPEAENYSLSDPALIEYLEEYDALSIDDLAELVNTEEVWFEAPEENTSVDEFYDAIDITDLEDIIL